MATLLIAHDGTYSTFAAAEAAAVSGVDTIQIGYLDADEALPTIINDVTLTKKSLTVEAVAPVISPCATDPFATPNQQLIYRGITFIPETTGGGTKNMYGDADATLTFDRCIIINIRLQNRTAGPLTFYNCNLINAGNANNGVVLGANSRVVNLYNCTVVDLKGTSPLGISGFADSIYNVYNCILAARDGVDIFYNDTAGSYTVNDSHNITTKDTTLLTGTKYVRDSSAIGLIATSPVSPVTALADFRIDQTDELAGTTSAGGTDLATLYTTDIDGRTRSQYSIGASEGFKVYSAPSQAAPATDLAPTDTGDGVTWRVQTATTEAAATVRIYDHSDDSLITILDTDAITADLTAGQEIYCKIGAAEKTLSERYPAAAGITVPTLAAPSGPDIPTATWTDNGDGTGAVAAVTSCTAGAINTVYTRALGESAWTEQGTINGTGSLALDLETGSYWGYVESTTAGGCASSAPYRFVVTDADAEALMKQLRDGVAALLNDYTFQVDVSITSGFLAYHNLETETDVVDILVAPGQVDVDSEMGGYSDDIRDMAINIALLRKATTDAEADECLRVAEDIYTALHNQVVIGSRCTTKQFALTYDEDYLRQHQQFRGVMRFYFRRTA